MPDETAAELRDAAKRALQLLDLTNLNDDCDAGAIRDLCARATTPFGPVARTTRPMPPAPSSASMVYSPSR